MMRNYGFFDYGFVFNEQVLKVFYYLNRDALKNEFGIEREKIKFLPFSY